MYYIRHYSYISSNPRFKEYLEDSFGIPCKKLTFGDNQTDFSYFFDVPENHPLFEQIEPHLPKLAHERFDPNADPHADYVDVMYFPEYSMEEMEGAKWFEVRSSFSKVLPEDTHDLTTSTCLARVTGHGIKQMRHTYFHGNFVLKSPVKWGRRYFASASGMSEYILFCNSEARIAMEKASLKGLKYEIVRKKSTGAEMENIYYLRAQNTLADGAIVPISDMDTYICDQCGMHMVGYRNTRGQFGIRADLIDDSVDFYRTLPLFSPGLEDPSSIFGNEKFIVSQRFYHLVKELKMDRALWFEPINLV